MGAKMTHHSCVHYGMQASRKPRTAPNASKRGCLLMYIVAREKGAHIAKLSVTSSIWPNNALRNA